MKRREFSTIAAASLLAVPHAQAQGRIPQDGGEYVSLDRQAQVEAPAGKIEVIEFFWYSCPHCNAFEPKLEAWIKRAPKDVLVRRVPVRFRDHFVPQQKLFYALEALGKLDDVHPKVFHAIHMERQPLNTEPGIASWIEKQGIDRAKFLAQYNSFSVETKAARAVQLQDAYKVAGVPAIGIAGRFYTDGTMASNMDRALQVTDYLIAQVRAGK